MMNKEAKGNIAKLIHQATSASSEKRKDSRVSLHLPIEYSFPDSPGHRFAYTVDISEGGLLMCSTQKMEVGQNFNLKFYYYSAAGLNCAQALGEVIRADRLGKSEKDYRYAVRFIDLSSDALKKLRKFFKSLY